MNEIATMRRRRIGRYATSVLATCVLAVGLLVGLSAPASAGQNLNAQVHKVIVGTAPAGATFTVHYACTGAGQTGDLQFDATGAPTPPDSNFFNSLSAATCTVSETVTGGAASVSIQCVSGGPNAVCDPSGASATFDGGISTGVTFTVTNTFTAATAAAALPAAADFTG